MEHNRQTAAMIKISLTLCILLLAGIRIFIISRTGTIRHGFWEEQIGMLLIAVFPIAMWYFARVAYKRFKKPVSVIVYYVTAIVYIYLTLEVLFKHRFTADKINIESDVISAVYMIALSAVILWLSIKQYAGGLTKADKAAVIIGAAVISLVWLAAQDRIGRIAYSVNEYSMTDTDTLGNYQNWFAHRGYVLKAVIAGGSIGVDALPMFSWNKCSLVWIRYNYGLIFVVGALVIIGFMLNFTIRLWRSFTDSHYALLGEIICTAALAQACIGIPTNLFVIYVSHIGVPILHSLYTVIPFIVLLFAPSGVSQRSKL